MPDIEVVLDDDTEVIRVYKRFDSETYAYAKLRAKDFARVMARHSGISMWRNCSDQDAMDRYVTDQKKGAVRIKAKLLKELGFKFFSPSFMGDHLSVRCNGCNLHVDYSEGLCEREDETRCQFDITPPPGPIPKTLANKQYFSISTPIT